MFSYPAVDRNRAKKIVVDDPILVIDQEGQRVPALSLFRKTRSQSKSVLSGIVIIPGIFSCHQLPTMMTTQRINLIFCLLVVTQLQYFSRGFQPIQSGFQAPLVTRGQSPRSHVIRFAVQQEEEMTTTITTTPPVNEEAARLRKEAELMRLQAEQMDMSLTLQKIEALESKLKNKSWLAKHPDQEVELQMQLQRLNDKLATATNAERGTARMPNTLVEAPKPVASPAPVPVTSETIALPRGEKPSPTNASLEPPNTSKPKTLPQTPLAGFDQEDLDLYIPIAEDINKMMPNGTIEEKLEAFRTAPELQSHFQKKIQNMLMGPLEEMQQLDKLRQEYLDSNSSKEREQLKREIEKLEKVLEEDGPFRYSEGIYCDGLEPLTDEELARRKEAVGALPDILIAIYKQRNSLGEDDDLELAIQMDYYEPQLQLLEQVRLLDPLEDDMRTDYIRGFNSLPKPVQQRYAQNNGVDKDSDAETVLKAALEESSFLSPLLQVVEASGIEAEEYNDIEFVDRSRFLEEFFPSIGNMEGSHPSMDDVERFSAEVLDKKCFMVSSKPERVAGGYYIRGTNLLNDDEDGTKTAADKLVAKVSEKLESSPLKDRLEFFYVLDPTPLTDEEIELGEREKPIFVVTTKDPQNFYRWAKPLTKFGVSLTGVLSTFMFSVGACALNPSIAERFYNTLDQSAESGVLDLTWFADLFIPTFAAFLGIQLSHELAHRAIALRDKVRTLSLKHNSLIAFTALTLATPVAVGTV